ASRTTLRLTPNAAASSVSFGRASPGLNDFFFRYSRKCSSTTSAIVFVEIRSRSLLRSLSDMVHVFNTKIRQILSFFRNRQKRLRAINQFFLGRRNRLRPKPADQVTREKGDQGGDGAVPHIGRLRKCSRGQDSEKSDEEPPKGAACRGPEGNYYHQDQLPPAVGRQFIRRR